MRKIFLYSLLLILGLIASQLLVFVEVSKQYWIGLVAKNLALIFLAFIIIHVGVEFVVKGSRVQQFEWDYFIALAAAAMPWLFCALYFIFLFEHGPEVSRGDVAKDAIFLAKFAAPTSAGLLFTMLLAAGLEKSWVFQKSRILAIFDDLNTVLLFIPLKIFFIGFKWESLFLLFIISLLVFLFWKKRSSLNWSIRWFWVLFYSIVITSISEAILHITTYLEDVLPLQIEVLFPAFVLGSMLSANKKKGIHAFFNQPQEKIVRSVIEALFIFLVGFSMPMIKISQAHISESSFWDYKIEETSLKIVVLHTVVLTFLMTMGKMVPLFCYKNKASWKERLALSMAMCPRGEIGAGVLILALNTITKIDEVLVLVAILALVLNILLTGPFILIVQLLAHGNKFWRQPSKKKSQARLP